MEENVLKNDRISEAVYIVVKFEELPQALLNFYPTIPIPQAPTTF